MALPINATITFSQGTGVFTTDPETGNPIEGTNTVTVKASIKQKTDKNPHRQDKPGLDPASVWIEGYAVHVLETNGTINKTVPPLPNNCQITIVDPATGQTMLGTLSIDTTIQSKFQAVTKALGKKIQGYFLEAGK